MPPLPSQTSRGKNCFNSHLLLHTERCSQEELSWPPGQDPQSMTARHSQATLLPAFLPESLPRMSLSLSPHTDADPELPSATEPMKLYRVYLFSHLSPFQMWSSPRARALSSTPSEEALTGGVGGVVERGGMCLPLPVLPQLVVSGTVPQGPWPLTVSICHSLPACTDF